MNEQDTRLRQSRRRPLWPVLAAMVVLTAVATTGPARACVSYCDGNVDTAWGSNGNAVVVSNNVGRGLLLPLADGKVVEVTTCRLGNNLLSVCATRLDPDGAMDTGFGVGGHAVLAQMAGPLHNLQTSLVASGATQGPYISYSAAALAPDGHMLIAVEGQGHRSVVRLRGDGKSLDGVLTDPLPQSVLVALLVQRDGKVVLVGHGHPNSPNYVTVARYLPDLSAPDATFGFAGVSFLDPPGGVAATYFHDLAQTADGAIALAGGAYIVQGANSWYEGYVARLTPSGSYDAGFDGDGRWRDFYSTGYARIVANRQGMIYVAGNAPDSLADSSDLRVAGLLPDATLLHADNYSSPTCGNGVDYAAGLALQNDGNLLLAGICLTGPEALFIEMTRLSVANGSDIPFGTGGYVDFQPAPAMPVADGIAVGAGGLLLDWRSGAAGDNTRRITRFTLDRIFPSSFDD